MKNKDKVLVAFLVSAGLFSAFQAKQYVSDLSDQQKNDLVSVEKMSGQVLLAAGSAYGDGNPGDNKPANKA